MRLRRCGAKSLWAEYYDVSFAALPQPSLRAFAAAGIADVFGAMGSWDDEPPSMAQEMGLGGEYDRLSDELLAQKNSAILFAMNGWWGFGAGSKNPRYVYLGVRMIITRRIFGLGRVFYKRR